jgi:HEAT repeat protein
MSKSVLQPFEDYQKARISFVQHIAELATRPQNIPALHSAGVMGLLRPLLLDSVNSIQQSAALAIGRLANFSEDLAESVIQNDIVPQLIYSLSGTNRFFRKAACYVLRAVAKHSPKLANDLVAIGALPPLVRCLEDFDPSVKESAAWALGYISKHNAELARQVVETRAVDNLVLCLQEPEMDLKRAASQTLCYISSHTEHLAQPVVESGLEPITTYLSYNDVKLKKNVCLLLGNIAKHTCDLADKVINKVNVQKLLACLKENEDLSVRKNAAFCVRELVNKNTNIASNIVSNKGAQVLVDFISTTRGETRLHGILSLGFIASFKEDLAYSIIRAKGLIPLKDALDTESSMHIKAAVCFTLGHLGRHSAQHAKELADENVLSLVLYHLQSYESNDELKEHAKEAAKTIIDTLNCIEKLEPLLHIAPENIQKHILYQLSKNLRNNKEGLLHFLSSGGLKYMQELKIRVSDILKQKIDEINQYYPDDVVKYHSPDYRNYLLEKIT